MNRAPANPIRLPAGRDLAGALTAFLHRVQHDALQRIRHGQHVNLTRWLAPMTQAVRPFYTRYVQQGAEQSARRIVRQLRQAGRPVQRAAKRLSFAIAKARACRAMPRVEHPCVVEFIKDFRRDATFSLGFDVYNPLVSEAIDRAVFDFCRSTLDTATTGIFEALAKLHRGMREGLEQGEGVRELNARVGEIFLDPFRASRIAASEASRATHQGQLLAAQESNVVSGMRWLCSADACEKCLALDGKEVKLGEPFYVDPKGGTYAVVTTPPLHPFCQCSATEILGEPDSAAQSEALTTESRMIFPMQRVGGRQVVTGRMAASWRHKR